MTKRFEILEDGANRFVLFDRESDDRHATVFPSRASAEAAIAELGGNPELDPCAALPAGEYAIAEILGHSTMIGRVAEVERFGTKMLQIEPIFENKLLPAVFVGGSSLYRFTPCSKEVAFLRQAKQRYQLPEAVRATLPPETPPALSAPRSDEDRFGLTPDAQDSGGTCQECGGDLLASGECPNPDCIENDPDFAEVDEQC